MGPIGCPETSVFVNKLCVITEKSSDIYFAVEARYHAQAEMRCKIQTPGVLPTPTPWKTAPYINRTEGCVGPHSRYGRCRRREDSLTPASSSTTIGRMSGP
jgi:hypothetical protein